MSTLLVNPKMNPMLAARVDASVRGRRQAPGTPRASTRLVSLLRFGAIIGALLLIVSVLWSRHKERVAFERDKKALFADWQKQASDLKATDREFIARIDRILAEMAGTFAGEYVAAGIQSDSAFSAALSRRSVYVRGSAEAFGSPDGVAKAAATSGKDSLLLCLVDPPGASTEKALLPKARIALTGGAPLHQLAPQVHRLYEVQFGLPYLLPPWGARIEAARDIASLQRLERELRKAPVSATKVALSAELLIAVLDEPNDSDGVTELDGEHAHNIRLVIWDLIADIPLLRVRRHVDPSWITANRRSQFARELDSCKLAIEAREALRAPPTR